MALLLLAGVTVFYCVSRTQVNRGMLYGAVYVSIFAMVFIYNLGAATGTFRPGAYLQVISVLAAAWVVVKLVFRKNTVFLKVSGFELLMVLLSWFLPFVLLEDLRLPGNVVEAGRMACLQVIPFMFTAKITSVRLRIE